jgi:hypothetical protein
VLLVFMAFALTRELRGDYNQTFNRTLAETTPNPARDS